MKLFLNISKSQAIFENIISAPGFKMAMWKYLKRFDEKIFENIFFEILSLPYFRKFSHSKISTYTVVKSADNITTRSYSPVAFV